MEEPSQDETLLLEHKANIFFKSQQVVHITFKKGFWKRGVIVEVSSDFFMLNERKEGMQPVFFLEIKDIMQYNERKKGDDNGRKV